MSITDLYLAGLYLRSGQESGDFVAPKELFDPPSFEAPLSIIA